MSIDNDCFCLKSKFLEIDGFFIGGKTHNSKRGLGTNQQSFLLALGTDKLNKYPNKIKVLKVKSENKFEIKNLFKQIEYNQETTVCTDRHQAYLYLKEKVNLINGIIDYNNHDHLMHWLNVQISKVILKEYIMVYQKNILMNMYKNMYGDSITGTKVLTLCSQ